MSTKMFLFLNFFIFIISNQVYIIHADNQHIMGSTFQMKEELKQEINFLKELKFYLQLLKKEVTHVENFINNNYNDQDIENLDIDILEDYVSNPINAFGIIKRTHKESLKKLNLESSNSIINLQKANRSLMEFINDAPAVEDFYAATESIALIQESYNLNTSDLSKSIINFHGQIYQANYKFTLNDRVNIAITAANKGWFDNSIEWLQQALSKDNIKKRDSKEDIKRAKYTLKQIKSTHDAWLNKSGPVSKIHRTFAIPFDSKLRKKKKFKKVTNQGRVDKHQLLLPLFKIPSDQMKGIDTAYKWNFLNICAMNSTESMRIPLMDSQLQCRYQHHSNPYLKLGPFKWEELNQEPLIILFHDFLEPNSIIQRASTELKISLTGHSGLGTAKSDTTIRNSKQAWISGQIFEPAVTNNTFIPGTTVYHSWNPNSIYNEKVVNVVPDDFVLSKINKRIQLATKTSIIGPHASEKFQVANYGIGGQYSIHLDPHDFYSTKNDGELQRQGDRFGTFMTYLSDVEAGGGTVFPILGVKANAKKGSAIFWINLRSSGAVELLTFHGGCPVLIGSKWISNKWILNNDQVFRFPCALNRNAVHDSHQKYKSFNNH